MTIDIHSHDETSPTPEHGAASPESIHHMQTSGEKATEIGKQGAMVAKRDGADARAQLTAGMETLFPGMNMPFATDVDRGGETMPLESGGNNPQGENMPLESSRKP